MDIWLIKDLLKKYKEKPVIGYYIENIQNYNKALASVRMRVYDVIDYLEKTGISAELYKENREYKIVVIYKPIKKETLELVKKLKRNGMVIIYEGIHDYIVNKDINKYPEWEFIEKIIKLSDCVITIPGPIEQEFKKYIKNVYGISEAVDRRLLTYCKDKSNHPKCDLVYCGYSNKAKDLLFKKNILNDFQKYYNSQLWVISECDPQLDGLNYRYIKYDNRRIAKQLAIGDVFIAPRMISDGENIINSINKIAYPMAIGLPVVASPVNSYKESPALLCTTDEEWEAILKKLHDDVEYRYEVGELSAKYVKDTLSMDKIGPSYIDIYKKYI